MYSVTIEPEHQLMRIRVDGFWRPDVLRGYTAELTRKVSALQPRGGCKRILVDMSDYPIQSRRVADAHAKIIDHARNQLQARTAVIMTSSLSRLQAMRVARFSGHELFNDEASARRWLLS